MFKPANNATIDLTSSDDYCKIVIENFIWSTTAIKDYSVLLDLPTGYRYRFYPTAVQRVIFINNV